MSESGNNSQQSAESLLLKELYEFCNSDYLSIEGLHEIIERHNHRHDVSDYKFFLRACINKRVNEGIIQCLLENFPVAISATDYLGQTPLHYACCNKNMTVNIIQLLFDAAPETVRIVNSHGRMPLHNLCHNKIIEDAAALEIMKLLIEKCPEAIRHANNNGNLPIHLACRRRTPQFFRLLIEAYPGSERIADANGNGLLPFHLACASNTLATVEYFYKLYPDAVNHEATAGGCPIQAAIMGTNHRGNPLDSVDIVKFLLECDPNVTLQKVGRKSPLHYACRLDYNESNIQAAIEIIKAIYDANPEAIVKNRIASDIQRYHEQVQTFINSQLGYARQAKDHRLMTTPDDNGRLPLHTALQNNVRLGTIKLLVKGNPSAIRNADTKFAMPLHVACQHHNSSNVVHYLVGLDTTTLDAVDREGNTALHLACRSAKYETIALLLETYDAVSVSKRNAYGKLPMDLLLESYDVLDRESVEYTESVFRLLKAYPEMIMVMNMCFSPDERARRATIMQRRQQQ